MQEKKRPLYKRIKYALLFAMIWGFLQVTRVTPRKVILWGFTMLSGLAYYLLLAERRKIIKNLRYALGDELTENEIQSTARKVFLNVGRNFADIVNAFHINTYAKLEPLLEIEGIEHLEKAYETGKGVIAATCHLGPYEMVATFCALKGFDTHVIATALKDPRLDKMLVNNRTSRGANNIPRGKDNIKIVKALKNGGLLIILIDQDTRVNSVFVDFFGKPTYTPIGAAMLSLRTGAKIVPFSIHRVEKDKLKITILPEYTYSPSGDEKKDIHDITAGLSAELEKLIRQDISQWVWMHERWKTKPE
ncbi:MAG: lysophospholipid acyltransferase family protein [Cyclobacteriaceae bacterium]|nr:lysophospholipid acyltransferase family protein [Cyclobacteriaceae bacterium]